MNRTLLIISTDDQGDIHLESLSDQPNDMTLPNAVAGVIGRDFAKLVHEAMRTVGDPGTAKTPGSVEDATEIVKPSETLRLVDPKGGFIEGTST